MRVVALLRHPVIREWLVIALFLAGGSVCALHWGWFSRLDQTLYDKAIGLIQRAPQDDIVIVGIDEESLAQIGRFPWSRDKHAALINKLTVERAKVIGLDIVLTESDTNDANVDRLLSNAIRDSGRVILPVIKSIEDGRITGDMPPVPLQHHRAEKRYEQSRPGRVLYRSERAWPQRRRTAARAACHPKFCRLQCS